jgi:hypothetical protein
MLTWTIIVVCYLFGAGFFYLVGGLGSASEAVQGWARTSTAVRSSASPTSS